MNREKLIAQLEVDEDKRSKPYRCTAGKLTIGVGRNIEDRGLSDDEIRYLLNNDIDIICRELDRAIPWWREMDDARQNVFINMCFMGVPRFLGFKKMLACAQAKRYDAAAGEMIDSKWADQVGHRAARLARVMRTGMLT